MGFSNYMFKGSQVYLHRYFNGYNDIVYGLNWDTHEIKTYAELCWWNCRDKVHKIKILYSFDDNTIKLYKILTDFIEIEQELLNMDANNIVLDSYKDCYSLTGYILSIKLQDGSSIELDLSENFWGTQTF